MVMIAGRLHENKGIDVALYALRRLPEHVHYLIVGEGGQRDALEAMVDSDGLRDRVTFVGWVDNITPFAAASDIWLVPSRHEPLGNTVLDAWAHALPVVAAAAAGPLSLITDNHDGLLAEIEDDKTLAEGILKLIENPSMRQKLGENGRKTLGDKYSQESVLQAYYDLYVQMAHEG